jgi:hypothetical protein
MRQYAPCYSACVQPRPPQFGTLVKALTTEEARFVVIGGFALLLHGGRHTTMDSDFAIAADAENAAAVVRALASFGPEPTHLPAGMPFIWDERSIRGAAVSLRSDCGDIDLLLTIPGVESFEALLSRSIERELDGVRFRIASIPDLMAMKEAAGRPQDLAHIEELRRIQGLTE